jgi:hypothetical protein
VFYVPNEKSYVLDWKGQEMIPDFKILPVESLGRAE